MTDTTLQTDETLEGAPSEIDFADPIDESIDPEMAIMETFDAIAELQALKDSYVDTANKRVAMTQEWLQSHVDDVNIRLAQHEAFLQGVARENYNETKKKSMSFPNGKTQLRKVPVLLQFEDEENLSPVVEKLVEIAPDTIKTERKILKNELKALLAQGITVPGVTLSVSGEDDLSFSYTIPEGTE